MGSYGQIWLNNITTGQPINSFYLGDKLSSGTYYQFEIGQASWNASDAGIGQNSDANTGWNWATASWYADGAGSNKQVQRDFSNFQFTAQGTWYITGRAKANSGDSWTYSDQTWNNNSVFSISTSAYYTVNALNTPTAQTATMASANSIHLAWNKSAQNNDVLVIRSTTNSFTVPTNGTSYVATNTIGTGTVVYKGNSTSGFTDTSLTPNTTYYYAFYSENYTYYSTAVTASATTLATISGYTASSGTYTGSSILINGSGFTGTSAVLIGGINATSFVVNSNTQISAVIGQNASGNTITVTNNSQNATYSPFTYQGYITTGTNWNTGSNWLGGSVPPSAASVTINTAFQDDISANVGTLTINDGITLQLTTGTNLTVSSNNGLTLGSGSGTSTIDLKGQTLTLSGGGNLSLNGSSRYITSSVAGGVLKITGATMVSNGGALTLDTNTKVDLQNGLDCGSGHFVTINGTLQINGGGYCTGHSPIYGSSSLLQYNAASNPYNRQLEWTSNTATIGTTPGYPNNVQVSNNTTLNYVNSGNLSPIGIAGNITIDSGCSLHMNYGSTTCGGALTIANNFTSAGTMSLGFSVGDDLKIGGNFSNTGTFNCNSRLVLFNSTTTGKTISGTITGTSKIDYLTFNGVGGSWSIANDLEISSALAVTNGSVDVNSSLTTTVGGAVTVTAPGTLTFEDQSSLLQTTFTGTNSGNITYKRTTPAIFNTDYTYWSSPVSGYTLGGVSPNTLPGMFYSFSATSTPANWKQESSATTMVAGVGYIIRGPEYTGTPPLNPIPFSTSFIGVPNNGTITTPITSSGDPTGTSNLIGNPYPSAISADLFLVANSGAIDVTLYFWTHNTQIQLATGITNGTAGSGLYAYTSDDYASYNLLGGVATALAAPSATNINAINTNIPSGKIAAGQGFFTTSFATSVAGTTNASFTNAMRVTGNNSQFFKLANTKDKTAISIEKDRIWLNLTNSQGAFKQTLVGYMTGATNGYDPSFDGESLDGNQFIDFYSINQDKKLTIQGRAVPFNENDVVPLGFSTTIDGTLTINIGQIDGLLTDQTVYIEDKITNTFFDLKSGSYTFTTTSGTFNDRFALHYTDKNLGINTVVQKTDEVLISSSENQIKINSTNETISSITVYDITGKKILFKENINKTDITLDKLSRQNNVILVKVILANDQQSTHKVIF